MDIKEPKNIVIIGGSIAGLMTGLILARLPASHTITILESRPAAALQSQAAGLGLGNHALALMQTIIPTVEEFAVRRGVMQFIGKEGKVVAERDLGIEHATSSWGVVYRILRREVEGLGGVYREGWKVTNLRREEEDAKVVVTCSKASGGDDGGEGKHEEEEMVADMVIVASGAYSHFRKMFDRKESEYAGFLLWRGSVPESKLPVEMAGAREHKFLFSMVKDSYCLGYLAPNSSGSLEPGQRSFEWAHYDYCPSSSPEFKQAMTDIHSHTHAQTVSRGLLNPDVWHTRITRAHAILPSPWAKIAELTEGPLVSAISSSLDTKALYWDNTVLFVGEAYTQFRPHLGLGSNLAAFQALRLGEAMAGEMEGGLEEWERVCGEFASVFAEHSAAMGVRGLTGAWPEGYVPVVDHLEGV
ncbi:hypothetical protein BDV96DRAFT_671378 [Lophiotrema nucula]|uniref:2,6-dihydroxypyridine 3-monooxygenase substrate binding domain-containing protein n=1 Tax=Lophiotrema nucula TaxID=690887 RepID=A0A6A5YMN1_9PLEO|nr:hypothetical protein BDV96DRAFT_671378 [Lophiotrema nucula]